MSPRAASRQNRSVSFSPHAYVKLTLHVNDYSDKEIGECWLSAAETKTMRAEAMQAFNKMRDGADIDDSQCCPRGLEFLSPKNRRSRMRNRIRAWAAVFNEQDRQIEDGIWEDEAIAAVYKNCCYKSSVAASLQGVSDERALGPLTKRTEGTPRKSPKPLCRKPSRSVVNVTKQNGRIFLQSSLA